MLCCPLVRPLTANNLSPDLLYICPQAPASRHCSLHSCVSTKCLTAAFPSMAVTFGNCRWLLFGPLSVSSRSSRWCSKVPLAAHLYAF